MIDFFGFDFVGILILLCIFIYLLFDLKEVAQEFVNKWCLIYGWPNKIQTDQGGEFTGKVLKAITEAAKVKRSTTMPYHPQANGQVERTLKTIAQMLSKRCFANQRTWSKILVEVIYEYNYSKHKVTGWTPFYMTDGRHPKL
jgi:transposase InsO family protein